MKKIKVAIAGNPNAGKTTIFNNLTGGRQRVGNYSGVTVEKRTGFCKHGDYEIEITDLPGAYGLTTWSLDEKASRDFILHEDLDIIIDVVDASNLERNLYLTTQLMEFGVPLVLAFNMSDVARAHGWEFDLKKLTMDFAAPIVPMIGSKNEGTKELLDAIVSVVESEVKFNQKLFDYGHDIEDVVSELEGMVGSDKGLAKVYAQLLNNICGARWLAIKMLEQDEDILSSITSPDIKSYLDTSMERIAGLFADSAAVLMADKRYGYISGACQEAVRSTVEIRHTASDKVDAVITHRHFGIPIFMIMMYMVFNLVFKIGEPLMGVLETMFGWLGSSIESIWPAGVWEPLKSLIVDGIIGGVGGVVVFLPNIMLLFTAIAFLEYSGYMARAAFVVDRMMHRIGLHGKSFIPMLIGFGCSVPAIMATRTLDSRRDRLVTMLIIPLMSCGARVPIYTLIIPAFFPEKLHSPMLWMMYMIGIVLAIACAKLLGVFVFTESTHGLVMELPPYRMPTAKCILIHTWERSWLYLKKAGTVILGISVIMWALVSYPKVDSSGDNISDDMRSSAQMEYSIAGRIGHAIEPVLRPMGFDWKIGTALIGAFAAKEVFVSQMGVVYAVGEAGDDSASLRSVLQREYNPLVGFCIMLFCLIGFPCMATCVVTRFESGSWKWAMVQFWGLTLLAYVVTTCVYQVGSLFLH